FFRRTELELGDPSCYPRLGGSGTRVSLSVDDHRACAYPSSTLCGRGEREMGKPTTVTWNGKRLEGRSMAFQPIHDHWNEYELENGGRLKVRVVLSEVVLVEDEKTATGDP